MSEINLCDFMPRRWDNFSDEEQCLLILNAIQQIHQTMAKTFFDIPTPKLIIPKIKIVESGLSGKKPGQNLIKISNLPPKGLDMARGITVLSNLTHETVHWCQEDCAEIHKKYNHPYFNVYKNNVLHNMSQLFLFQNGVLQRIKNGVIYFPPSKTNSHQDHLYHLQPTEKQANFLTYQFLQKLFQKDFSKLNYEEKEIVKDMLDSLGRQTEIASNELQENAYDEFVMILKAMHNLQFKTNYPINKGMSEDIVSFLIEQEKISNKNFCLCTQFVKEEQEYDVLQLVSQGKDILKEKMFVEQHNQVRKEEIKQYFQITENIQEDKSMINFLNGYTPLDGVEKEIGE